MRILLAAAMLPLALQAGEGGLAIENAWVQAQEDGSRAAAGYRFQPGDTVYFSFQVSGYKTEGGEFQERKLSLSWEVTVADPQGLPLVEPAGGTVKTTISLEDRLWKPIARRSFVIPGYAPGGQYRIRVVVRDELAHQETSQDVDFRVAGRPAKTVDHLEVDNFRFLRSAEDKEALEVPAYSPGDMVWARFDMSGYKLDAGNRYSLEYGVRVLRGDGSVVYEQAAAAAAENASFYPQRVTPGLLSLRIPKDQAKAAYTLVVMVEDKAGGQKCEAREKFTVE
jgi:hypothetical protein